MIQRVAYVMAGIVVIGVGEIAYGVGTSSEKSKDSFTINKKASSKKLSWRRLQEELGKQLVSFSHKASDQIIQLSKIMSNSLNRLGEMITQDPKGVLSAASRQTVEESIECMEDMNAWMDQAKEMLDQLHLFLEKGCPVKRDKHKGVTEEKKN